MKYFAPAKINLGLKLPARYKNGHHFIVTPISRIDLGDELFIEQTTTDRFHLELKSDLNAKEQDSFKSAFVDIESNILYKAFQKVKSWQSSLSKSDLANWQKSFPERWGLKVIVTKNIPAQAGLGAGSADAVALLRYFVDTLKKTANNNLRLGLETQILRLGSDLPALYYQTPVICLEGGEKTHPIEIPCFEGILMLPNFACSTVAMYDEFRRQKPILSEAKKPLQHEKYLKSIQSLWSAYNLVGHFFSAQAEKDKLKALISRLSENDIIEEKSNYLWLQNDFWQIAQSLYAQNTKEMIDLFEKIALNIQKLAIKKQICISNSDLIFSMSGSGSAFYCLFSYHLSNSLNKKDLVAIIDYLNSNSKVQMQYLTNKNWAVAKR